MAQQYTRRAIRETFVGMLNDRPFNKITVKDIVTACEINRNTFYYYYADLYEILEEIFQTELAEVIDTFNATNSWEEAFIKAAGFTIENKKAVLHVFHSIQRETLENYLYTMAGKVMIGYVENESKGMKVSKADKKLIASFYQSALSGMVISWISEGMKENPEVVIRRIGLLFDGNIQASLMRSEVQKDTW